MWLGSKFVYQLQKWIIEFIFGYSHHDKAISVTSSEHGKSYFARWIRIAKTTNHVTKYVMNVLKQNDIVVLCRFK